jgi:hypothetical protein
LKSYQLKTFVVTFVCYSTQALGVAGIEFYQTTGLKNKNKILARDFLCECGVL